MPPERSRSHTGIDLRPEVSLQATLSPQQIQFVNLLQLNNLALEQRIQTELMENPMLEEDLDYELSLQEDQDNDGEEPIDFEWDELLPDSADDSYSNKTYVDTDERPEIPQRATLSLVEDLHAQLSMFDLGSREELIATQIIGSINDDGYLKRDLSSIIDDLLFTYREEVTVEDIEEVLKLIHTLDPPGIGARNLQECLLVQLQLLPSDTPGRSTAIDVLSDYYEDFTKKRFAKIRNKLDVDSFALNEAFEVIQRLSPKPGEGTLSTQENQITPDFEVRTISGQLEVSMIGWAGPKIHISPQYHSMLQELTPTDKPIPRKGPQAETRKFLKQRFDSARWFLDAVHQRRRTLLLVMRAIVEKQPHFFTSGAGHLKPLILSDIAEMISMDISTISRVVSRKYVQTDFGVYALKYFFSEGVATKDGDMISNTEVKAIVVNLISEENKADPLSDQKITDILNERGFLIARRTVSKYRQQLGLPVARMRREIVLT